MHSKRLNTMSVRNYAMERYRDPQAGAVSRYTDAASSVSGSESRSYTRDDGSRSYASGQSRYSRDSRSYTRSNGSYTSYRSGDSRGSRTYDSRSYDSRSYDSRSYRSGESYDSRSTGSRSGYTSYSSRVHPKPKDNRELMNGYAREYEMENLIHGGNNHNSTNEFDSLSESEKLSSILQCSDVERHKHNLSVEYFRFRKYLLFIPTLFIILFITVCGFVVDTKVIMDHMHVGDSSTREFLVLLIASMSFLALILMLLSNALDYNSKINMHKGAAVDLELLGDKIKMYRIERTMDQEAMEEEEERIAEMYKESDDQTVATEDVMSLAGNVPPTLSNALVPVPENGDLALAPGDSNLANAISMQKQIINKSKLQQRKIDKKNEALTKILVMQKVAQAKRDRENIKNLVEFYGYSVALQQISVGCKSDVPICISKFFDVMETRVELMSLSRTLGVAHNDDDSNNNEDDSSGRIRKNQIVRLCANEIYNEVNGYWAWPLMTPNVDGTIESCLKGVGQLLNMNHRARKRCKIFPCCSIPLCCKKKASSNVFAIINEGIDQRELDMMQVERMELMRREKERKARRMAAKPEEVLEMGGGVADGARRKTEQKQLQIKNKPHRDDNSLPSIDPDGQTFAGMITEGTASTYSRAPRDPRGHQLDRPRGRHIGDEESQVGSQYDSQYQSRASHDEREKSVRLLMLMSNIKFRFLTICVCSVKGITG